jgi:hypothetical protein
MIVKLIVNNMDSGNVTAERRSPSITSSVGACQLKVFSLWWNQPRVIQGLVDGWTRSCQQGRPALADNCPRGPRFTKRRSQRVAHGVLMGGEHCYSWRWIGEGRWDEMRIGRVRSPRRQSRNLACARRTERQKHHSLPILKPS